MTIARGTTPLPWTLTTSFSWRQPRRTYDEWRSGCARQNQKWQEWRSESAKNSEADTQNALSVTTLFPLTICGKTKSLKHRVVQQNRPTPVAGALLAQ
jgi:hypothetical protein